MSINNTIILMGKLKKKPQVFGNIILFLLDTYPHHDKHQTFIIRYVLKDTNKKSLVNLGVGFKVAIMGHLEKYFSKKTYQYRPQIMADQVKLLETPDEYQSRINNIGTAVINTSSASKYQTNKIDELIKKVADKYTTTTNKIKPWFNKEFNIKDGLDKYQAGCIISTLLRALKKDTKE